MRWTAMVARRKRDGMRRAKLRRLLSALQAVIYQSTLLKEVEISLTLLRPILR